MAIVLQSTHGCRCMLTALALTKLCFSILTIIASDISWQLCHACPCSPLAWGWRSLNTVRARKSH